MSRTTFDGFVFDGASFDRFSLRLTAQRLTVQYLTAQRLTAFEPWHTPRMFAESRTTPKDHTAAGSSSATLYLLPHCKVTQGGAHPALHGVVVRQKFSAQRP